jgi:hypothetical protein
VALQLLAGIAGAAVLAATLWSVLATVVVPRGIRSHIIRWVFVVNRTIFRFFGDRTTSFERRDRILAFQAPVQVLAQIVAWLVLEVVGFGLLMWSVASKAGVGAAFQQAYSSLCTLGFLSPHGTGEGALDALAALSGLGTVALQIGYLPTLYAAFNRREALITMLDSRAGVPSWGPELLARTHYGLGTGVSGIDELPALFEAWEQWSADVSESHATYLPLAWFRSPRMLSSWVTAQLAVLDAAALYLALLPNAPLQIRARLCLRGGFTCLGNIARAIRIPIPENADPSTGISLTYEEFVDVVERLRAIGLPIERSAQDAWPDFLGWRVNYEAAAYALAWAIDAPPALWSGPRRRAATPIAPLRPPTLSALAKMP